MEAAVVLYIVSTIVTSRDADDYADDYRRCPGCWGIAHMASKATMNADSRTEV